MTVVKGVADTAALIAENRRLREALESMMRDTGLVALMRPDQIERNRAALAGSVKQLELLRSP